MAVAERPEGAEDRELAEARRKADAALAQARDTQPEVNRLVRSLSRRLEENHFAEALAEALYGRDE